MIAVLITAIPGIIAGLFNRWLFLAALFAIIPIIYLVNRFSVIIKWNLVEGIIEDVTLVNDFNQPYTEAHIIFKTKIIWNMSAASRSGIMEITKKE